MFRIKNNSKNYRRKFNRLSNSTKKINLVNTAKRGGIKL